MKIMLLAGRLFSFVVLLKFGTVFAQSSTTQSTTINLVEAPVRTGFDLANEAIVRNLDSLVSLRFFKKEVTAQPRQSNKYGYAPDYIPPLSDSTISLRMRMIQSPIPLRNNSYVRGFIEMYGIRKKVLTERVLAMSRYYYPIFEAALDRYNMPLQLKHLAVVESALNPSAVSRVGASGPWQFMYRTGMQYGLKVNYYSDERRDPYLSADAACRFMRDLYHTYNDWLLVLAAYNCGPGNVNRAIRRSGGKTTFWEIMPYLPAETRGYVPAFIAVTYLMTYPAEHNLQPFAEVALPVETDTVAVQGPLPLTYFSQLLGMDSDVLALLNPQLKQKFVPAGYPEYLLRIPARLLPEFERKRPTYLAHLYNLTQSKVLAEQAREALNRLVVSNDDSAQATSGTKVSNLNWKIHKVRRGETLSSIAKRYDLEIQDINKVNILRTNRLRVGQEIKIYPKDETLASINRGNAIPNKNLKSSEIENDSTGKSSKQNTFTYRVRQGDSLWSISRKFDGLTVDDLMKLNNLTSRSRLTPGMVLRIQRG